MASGILTAELGNFQILGRGVELFHGTITFIITEKETLLYETPLFKFRGIDVNFVIQRVEEDKVKKKIALPIGIREEEEEEEILLIIKIFLDCYYGSN